jgi:hypothetical protein
MSREKSCFSSISVNTNLGAQSISNDGYLFLEFNMPDNKTVNTAMSLIETDKSKILGLTIGEHNVVPGQFIQKAGKHKTMHSI